MEIHLKIKDVVGQDEKGRHIYLEKNNYGTIKSYTDLEQSKKLAEILQLDSADMHWQYIEEDNGQLQWFCFPKDFSINQHDNIRAWSLAALLGVLKYPSLTQDVGNKWSIMDWTGAHCKSEYNFDNPIDACYEMILKLHELNFL